MTSSSVLYQRSCALFHYRGDWDPRGRPATVNGRLGTFLRSSTATGEDSLGNPTVVPPNQPAYQLIDGELAVLIRPADSPRTVESLQFVLGKPIVGHSGYLRFAVADMAPTGSIFHWGDDTLAETAAWAIATAGDATDWYEVAWSVDENGIITISAAADEGTPVDGTPSVANAEADETPASDLWLGGRGTISVPGIALAEAKIVAGARTMLQLREVF